jgi:lipoprotein
MNKTNKTKSRKMKKLTVKLLMALAVVSMGTACSSDDVIEGAQTTEQNSNVVTIHVSNPQKPGTRATVVGDYDVNVTSGRAVTYPTTGKITNYKYIWTVGDYLYTYDPIKDFVSTFVCQSVDENGAGATFTSTDAKWSTGNTIYLFASKEKPTVTNHNEVNFYYINPANAGFAWGDADKNTAVLTNTNFTGIGKIDKCPELANNGSPVRMECTLDVTPSMTMYFRDMMHDYQSVSLTQCVKKGEYDGYYDGATYNLSTKKYTPGMLRNTWLTLSDKDPQSFGKGVIYMPLVETKYDKVTISLIGKNKNMEGDVTTVRSIYTKNNFDAKAENNYYNLGDMAKWTKDADHLYIIGDATPFGWAQSTVRGDSTRIWPFTAKMKNEGNGVFTYIGPALGSGNTPTQMYSPSSPDAIYQAPSRSNGAFKFYFFNNGLYEGAGLMRKSGNDTDRETTSYYSTYDNSLRGDDTWKVVNAGVNKITVNVRTNKVTVEPYTGTLPTLQITKSDGSKETVNKLWLFGSATPLKNYTATMPLAFSYNAADDPNHFVWEGHLTKGYLKFPYIFGDYNFNQTSYLMPENGVTTTVTVANFANVHPTPIKTDGSSMKMIVGTNQDNQWEVTDPGFYRIIVDVNNMKVTFTKK